MTDATTENLRLHKFLNGRLKVTLIALHGYEVVGKAEHRSPRADDALPFLPFRVTGGGGAGLDLAGDLGLGRASCISTSTRFASDPSPTLRFGLSVGSVREAYFGQEKEIASDPEEVMSSKIEDEGLRLYEGPAGSCLSLWTTGVPGILVLAIEELVNTDTDGSLPSTVEHSPRDLASLLSKLARVKSAPLTLKSLGLGEHVKNSDLGLTEAMVRSSDLVRGERWVRAFSLVAQANLQPFVQTLQSDPNGFETVDEHQDVGYAPQFERLVLGKEPSVKGVQSLMSTQGRLALLNLDSMSVRHDYLAWGSENLLAAAIPVLGEMGEIERSFSELREAVTGPQMNHHEPESVLTTADAELESLERQTGLLSEARVAQIKRRFGRPFPGHEQAVVWTNSGQLASALDSAFEASRSVLDSVTKDAADVISARTALFYQGQERLRQERNRQEQEREKERERQEQATERFLQRRDSWLNYGLAMLAIVATIFAAFSVFAGVAVLPRVPWGWMQENALMIAFAPVVLVAIGVIPWILWRPRREDPRRSS